MHGLIIPALGLGQVSGNAAARQGAGRVVELAHKIHGFCIALLRGVFQQQKGCIGFFRRGFCLAQRFGHSKAHVGQSLTAQLFAGRSKGSKRGFGRICPLLGGVSWFGLGLIGILRLVRILCLRRGRGQGGFFRLTQQKPPCGRTSGSECQYKQHHKHALAARFFRLRGVHFKRIFQLRRRLLRFLKGKGRLWRFHNRFRLWHHRRRLGGHWGRWRCRAHAVPARNVRIDKRLNGQSAAAHAAQAYAVGIEIVHLVNHSRAHGQPQAAAVIVPGIGGEQGFAFLPATGAKAFAVRGAQQGKTGVADTARVKNLDDAVARAAPGIA